MKVDVVVVMESPSAAFVELAKSKGFEWERLYESSNLPSPEDVQGKVLLVQGDMPLALAAAAYRNVKIQPDGSLEVFQYSVEYEDWDNALCSRCKTFTGEEETYTQGIGITYSEGYKCTECGCSVYGL